MRNRRSDVVAHALHVLDTYGLGDLSMRRVAAELGVQPSALYHHVASKQELLAAVAEEVLARGPRVDPDQEWDAYVAARCEALRDTMLAYRDGAELVATVHAYGLGASGPLADLVAALTRGGLDPAMATVAGRTLLHYVLGHVSEEQLHLQAAAVGAIDDEVDARAGAGDFRLGLDLVLDGVRLRRGTSRGAVT